VVLCWIDLGRVRGWMVCFLVGSLDVSFNEVDNPSDRRSALACDEVEIFSSASLGESHVRASTMLWNLSGPAPLVDATMVAIVGDFIF